MAQPPRNLLDQESSPYLQLHAEQPVHWMPWGEAAFERAEAESKPVLLSIGYSTCHWCHVMARESFEDQEIADYLNEHFISIKLDREERPDIDALYMTAHQAMHEGAGGWPLNLFLTPDRKPFFSGTYFPPKAKANRAGFDQVLQGVNAAWNDKREQVTEFGANLITQLAQVTSEPEANSDLGKNFLPHTQALIRSGGDTEHYGWGRGPKFPQSSLVRFLLLSDDKRDQDYALKTCRRMAESGLYDQLNGGFHRYCVDREWIVPHFEKMLYDQAQLVETYLDAYLLSGDSFYATIARETCEYVLREMTSAGGSYYAAQDAQSESKEGKFACWTQAELTEVLAPDALELLSRYYDITEEGNFYDFSDPEALEKQNVLVVKQSLSQFTAQEQTQLAEIKQSLFAIREQRIPAATDTKILLDWNMLMVASLARAGYVLQDSKYLQAAQRAHATLLDTHKSEGNYYHSAKDDQRHGQNLGSDLSSLLYATRTLYHATLEPEYLQQSLELSEQVLDLFYDREHGGFYETAEEANLIMRLKGDFDNALPTVSSQMVRELRILAPLTGNKRLQQALDQTLSYHQATLQTMPMSLGELLLALAQTENHATLLLAQSDNKPDPEFIKTAHLTLPAPAVIKPDPGWSEFYQTLSAIDSGTTAYYCRAQACQLPTNDLTVLKKQLSNEPATKQ